MKILYAALMMVFVSCSHSETETHVRDTTYTQKKVKPLNMPREDTLNCIRSEFLELKYHNPSWNNNGGFFELIYKKDSEFKGYFYSGKTIIAVYDYFTYSYQISIGVTEDQMTMFISNRLNNDKTMPLTLEVQSHIQKVLDLCIEPDYCGQK